MGIDVQLNLRWSVRRQGYRLIPCGDIRGRYRDLLLWPCDGFAYIGPDPKRDERRYDLIGGRLKKHGQPLYHTLAGIPPDDNEAILRFANEYGCLTRGGGGAARNEHRYHTPEGLLWGETLSTWRHHIIEIGEAIALWKKGEAAKLAQKVESGVAASGGGRISLEHEDGVLRCSLNSRGLVDALWLQLAADVSDGQRLPRCAFCGNPFRRRANTKYCSNRCRTANCRKRKK